MRCLVDSAQQGVDPLFLQLHPGERKLHTRTGEAICSIAARRPRTSMSSAGRTSSWAAACLACPCDALVRAAVPIATVMRPTAKTTVLHLMI